MSKCKKILIADDEEDISWAISKSIENSGFDVDIRCVSDGDQALTLINREKFDLIISDLRMPGRSGLQVLSDAKRIHASTQVILMTAYSSKETLNETEAFNDFFYIEKPFEINDLRMLILDALKLNQKEYVQNAGIRKIVEHNCTVRSNLSLHISKNKENGSIYFKDGNIIHAECGKLIGELAFHNILRWNTANFRIHHDMITPQRTISKDWRTLLHQ